MAGEKAWNRFTSEDVINGYDRKKPLKARKPSKRGNKENDARGNNREQNSVQSTSSLNNISLNCKYFIHLLKAFT